MKDQSKYNLVVVVQIYSHTGRQNSASNLLTELKKDKYIPHRVSCSIKETLTVDRLLDELDSFLSEK